MFREPEFQRPPFVDDRHQSQFAHNLAPGQRRLDDQRVEIVLQSSDWADIHYRINGGAQMNVHDPPGLPKRYSN